MTTMQFEHIMEFRAATFHTQPGQRLHNSSEALGYVNERGFIFFWPIKNALLPSLWEAVAGNRPVADEHDDPGHITWGWKDEMLGKRLWYYARFLRRRNSIISLECLPYFYALSPNYGDYENDYLEQYEQGLMTMESKNVYEALLRDGPLDTIELLRRSRIGSGENSARFNRAIEDLQIGFKIMPVGIAPAGAWRYAFIYELTARHYPGLSGDARLITEPAARQKIMETYLSSVGAALESDISRLFRWRSAVLIHTIQKLVEKGVITTGIQIENHPGDWIISNKLL